MDNSFRKGGIGQIEEGKLQGRKFIIPNLVYVEKGTHMSGAPEFSLACLIHEKFVQSSGCPECDEEMENKRKANAEIGL